MPKPDDSTLSERQRQRIRQEALKALTQADAIGVFPTPIDRFMAVSKVELAREAAWGQEAWGTGEGTEHLFGWPEVGPVGAGVGNREAEGQDQKGSEGTPRFFGWPDACVMVV